MDDESGYYAEGYDAGTGFAAHAPGPLVDFPRADAATPIMGRSLWLIGRLSRLLPQLAAGLGRDVGRFAHVMNSALEQIGNQPTPRVAARAEAAVTGVADQLRAHARDAGVEPNGPVQLPLTDAEALAFARGFLDAAADATA